MQWDIFGDYNAVLVGKDIMHKKIKLLGMSIRQQDPTTTGRPDRMSHRKWRETKQQLI